MKPEKPFGTKADNELERDIEALFAVDPSPEFLARVRTRIAREPQPSTGSLHWLLLAAGAVAAATVVFVRAMVPLHEPIRTPAPSVVPRIAIERSVEPAPPVAPAVVVRRKTHKIIVKEPELLIPPSEAAALRRVLNGEFAQFSATWEAPTTKLQSTEIEIKPLAPPDPITIAPIEPTPVAD